MSVDSVGADIPDEVLSQLVAVAIYRKIPCEIETTYTDTAPGVVTFPSGVTISLNKTFAYQYPYPETGFADRGWVDRFAHYVAKAFFSETPGLIQCHEAAEQNYFCAKVEMVKKDGGRYIKIKWGVEAC